MSLLQAGLSRRSPDRPPPTPTAARHAIRTDESALPTLLLESPSSLTWSDGQASYSGLDGLIGPPDGPHAAAQYLAAAPAAGAAPPESLLETLVRTARARNRIDPQVAGHLQTLADEAAQPGGRENLARLLTEHLDAQSHRVDAWITAAATQRLLKQRAAAPAADPVIGAYGYLTDVTPTTEPCSFGHIHAPSLAHAATAAVLRSGFLGQRRAAWASQLIAATAAVQQAEQQAAEWPVGGDGPRPQPAPLALTAALAQAQQRAAAARAGLAHLTALDPSTEADLPLAVDLSSQRVRQSQEILHAVRQGQPLPAVLGYLLERDLTDNGLAQYIPPLRKLTRFHTGTALDKLEGQRQAAETALAAAQQQLGGYVRVAVRAKEGPVAQASADLAAAQAAQQAAAAADQPNQDKRAELAALAQTIAQDRANLAAVLAARPQPATTSRTIDVPN